jgi:dTDP-glucose 4,6-dehydratase
MRKRRTVLVTGGFGFIGSNLVRRWLEHHPDDLVVVADCHTYAARPDFVFEYLARHPLRRSSFVEESVDIRDQLAVARLMQKYRPNIVFHLAAESHVCRSISGPRDFVHTNVLGTFNLLEEFRQIVEANVDACFIHVSTDEVFGELDFETDLKFDESWPMSPRSPYASTKASSDLLALSYFHTYGLPVCVTNCSNNFGRNQHDEKLIPSTLRRIFRGEPARIHGSGENVRDWLWVEDHCSALELLAEKGAPGERYCIGGNNEHTNWEVVMMLVNDMIARGFEWKGAEHTRDRPTDDKRYAINSAKLQALGWKPVCSDLARFRILLGTTVDYYLADWGWTGAGPSGQSAGEGVSRG